MSTSKSAVPVAEISSSQKTRELGANPESDTLIADDSAPEPLDIKMRAGDPLGLALAQPVPELNPELTTRDDLQSNNVPFHPFSTPEEVAEASELFLQAKQGETAEQKRRAHRQHGRVFSLMQYLKNAKTGEPLYSQEQLDSGLVVLRKRNVLENFAYLWQTKDRYNEKGATARIARGYSDVQAGDFVPTHVHIAIILKPTFDWSIRQMSDAFEIPASRIKKASEVLGDGTPRGGPGAGRRAFLDLVQYMTHENVWGDHSQPDGIPSWEGMTDE